jgi:nucleotide-binding universal stress UspA family protein
MKAFSMSIRIILTPLFGDDADAAAAQAAFAVTRRFDAHVEGLFARIDPLDTIPIVGEGVSPTVMDDLIKAAQVEMDKRASAAKAHFEAARTAAGVALAERPPAPGTSARWSDITGRREEVIARKARVSDLVVFGNQPSDSPELSGAIETTLVGGGRPLLLAPKGVRTIGERVAIAWNDSAESARALASALPFVEAASTVHVLTAETWRTRFEATEDLADYLEWRGIVCERRSIAAEDETVGAALLRAASEAGADLLVMGGYGRSRLRELVLGGVTRHVLTHAQLPVLLAH